VGRDLMPMDQCFRESGNDSLRWPKS
jgi:hypothetical protein